MGFVDLFRKNKTFEGSVVSVDMHSHLIHDVDDGSKNLQDSINMVRRLLDVGYRKLYTTPHIMGDFYKNSAENLLPKLDELKKELTQQGIACDINVAAEYYLDEWFAKKVQEKHKFLTMGDNYILVETSYLNRPQNFYEVIFALQTGGYKVILAHPERYTYLFDDFKKIEDIFERGVFFQLNLNSLAGYYSPKSKKIAEKLIDKQMVHFVGTDCHTEKHIDVLEKVKGTKYYQKLADLPLLNDSL